MKKDFTRLIVSIFCSFLGLTLLMLISCGGGGSSSSSSSGPTVTPPTQNITGTYTIAGFIVKYSNGTIYTEKNFSQFSGTMKIGMNTLSQSVSLNNTPSAVSATYSITYTQGTSVGTLHFTEDSGKKHDASFVITNNNFETYSGIVSASNGLTYEEWDIWVKTSDIIGIVTEPVEDQKVKDQKVEDQKNESHFWFIGELIIEKNIIMDR